MILWCFPALNGDFSWLHRSTHLLRNTHCFDKFLFLFAFLIKFLCRWQTKLIVFLCLFHLIHLSFTYGGRLFRPLPKGNKFACRLAIHLESIFFFPCHLLCLTFFFRWLHFSDDSWASGFKFDLTTLWCHLCSFFLFAFLLNRSCTEKLTLTVCQPHTTNVSIHSFKLDIPGKVRGDFIYLILKYIF